MMENGTNNGTEETGLVTPTPGPEPDHPLPSRKTADSKILEKKIVSVQQLL